MITPAKIDRFMEILQMSEMAQHNYLNWLKDQIFPKDGLHYEPYVEQGFVSDCEFLAEATQYEIVKIRAESIVERYWGK